MAKKENLALLLARRQKRLQFWKERFENAKPGGEHAERLKKLFSSYSSEIAKMVKAGEKSERDAAEQVLESLERELVTLFDGLRLMTSRIGVPSVPGE